ncbi:MAG: KH domain-containing protein [Verrucomicrobiota bacterium]
MAKRASKIASSLKQLGEIQVNDWDFMALLNTEINELEISRSLKRFGNIRVMEWDFRTVLPVVKKTANQEVDVVGFLKRTAHYKVMDWDFRSVLPVETHSAPPRPERKTISSEEMQAISLRLKNFLQFVVVNLIDEPNHAQIKVIQMGPTGLRFKLVMVKKDVAMLIGRGGDTAAAIRNILKATAESHGVQALLQIHTHEEEAALLAKEHAVR